MQVTRVQKTTEYYFKEGVTWTNIKRQGGGLGTIRTFNFRSKESNYIYR